MMVAAWVPAARAAAPADAPASFDARSVFIYAPSNPGGLGRPLQVVFALHGMGADGRGFCQGFLNAADRNGWLVVAPTFRYRNWKDPLTVAEDDVALTRGLLELLDSMPQRVGYLTTRRAVLLGFSRGAQLAHRFAFAYPERTRAVAAMSAGTYTVPRALDDNASRLNFPFGTADLADQLGTAFDERALARVPFWIGVGGDDNRVEDVPRQWDRLLGKTRVTRAAAFARELNLRGARSSLEIFPSVGHVMSPEMVRAATAFAERETAAAPPVDWGYLRGVF
jgi:poly(3-hydroxybutyrate) depolymerase